MKSAVAETVLLVLAGVFVKAYSLDVSEAMVSKNLIKP